MPDRIEDAELDAEFEAMRIINAALDNIGPRARVRVLRWACEKHDVRPPGRPDA